METQTSEWIDPRIRRTRQMLQVALEHLLESKSFEKISVGEIAEEATLNRATFYDHYPDKLALLEGLVSARFQELLDRRGVVFDSQCSWALMHIIRAMCDYLAPEPRRMGNHFESALIGVVRGMILAGLRDHIPTTTLPLELIAATVSGAIYGGVSEWARTPDRGSTEEAVQSIFGLVSPMLAALPS
jgi:AcrR family transcriptional regulator